MLLRSFLFCAIEYEFTQRGHGPSFRAGGGDLDSAGRCRWGALMKELSIFSDEAGCMGFRGHPSESRYFILCSVLTNDVDGLTLALSHMRRALLRKIDDVPDYFHATNDKQIVRDHVYDLLSRHDFRVRATIIRKSDVQDDLRQPPTKFLQFAWYSHFATALAARCLARMRYSVRLQLAHAGRKWPSRRR